jgi:hypothetical protein
VKMRSEQAMRPESLRALWWWWYFQMPCHLFAPFSFCDGGELSLICSWMPLGYPQAFTDIGACWTSRCFESTDLFACERHHSLCVEQRKFFRMVDVFNSCTRAPLHMFLSEVR